jgi:ABC-type multidrug transport system fused ATPase/permease subunit
LTYLIGGALSSLVNGAVIPLFTIAFGRILQLLNDVVANEDEIDEYCLYFFIIAIVGSVTAFLYNFNFGIVGDKLVYDLRIKIFDKLLKMPMKYFDKKENTPGAISTKLSNEAYQIHNMITGIIAVVCLNSTTVAVSLVIAMFHCWKIALITLGFTPILMISTSIHVSVTKRMASKSERSEKLIGSLISDTVSNIRTVKSFGRSTYFI